MLRSSNILHCSHTGCPLASGLHLSAFALSSPSWFSWYPVNFFQHFVTGHFFFHFEHALCLFCRIVVPQTNFLPTSSINNEEVLDREAGFRRDLFVPRFLKNILLKII
jgi:hypothetical protein